MVKKGCNYLNLGRTFLFMLIPELILKILKSITWDAENIL